MENKLKIEIYLLKLLCTGAIDHPNNEQYGQVHFKCTRTFYFTIHIICVFARSLARSLSLPIHFKYSNIQLLFFSVYFRYIYSTVFCLHHAYCSISPVLPKINPKTQTLFAWNCNNIFPFRFPWKHARTHIHQILHVYRNNLFHSIYIGGIKCMS